MKEKMKHLFAQLVKFGIVGVLATLLEWAIFYVLTNIVGIHYGISTAIGFGISTVFNYWASVKFVFDVIENGRFIGFDHSDPSMGGTMGNDIMSLELQGSESIPSKTSDSKETAEIPSIQKIGSMFDDMLKGKMSALTDYGFSMDDKQTKTESEEEEGIDGTSSYKYVVVKEIYSLNYKLYEKDGNMRVSYVYSKDYGGPSMTINCDSESWEQLKREAETTLKELSDDSYWLSTNSYVSFPKKGVISITSEDSISW